MALTATTTLSATDYTQAASFATGAYLSDWYTDPLKIKSGPNTSTVYDYHNHRSSPYANKYFDVREIINYSYAGVNTFRS